MTLVAWPVLRREISTLFWFPNNIFCASVTPKTLRVPKLVICSLPPTKNCMLLLQIDRQQFTGQNGFFFIIITVLLIWNLLTPFFSVDFVGMSLPVIWNLLITTVVTSKGKQALAHQDTMCFAQSMIAISKLTFTPNQCFTDNVLYSVKPYYCLALKFIKLLW